MNGIKRDWAAVRNIDVLRDPFVDDSTIRTSRAVLPQYRGDGYAAITIRYIRRLDVTARVGKSEADA